MKINKDQLAKAVKSGNIDDWRNYRKNRNKLQKTIQKCKKMFVDKKLKQPVDKWRFVKQMDSNQSSTPLLININGHFF